MSSAAAATGPAAVPSDLNSRFSNEEYNIWKKNSPYLYDALVSHSLEWPSLTVQWFNDKSQPEGKDYQIQRLLCGTHTENDKSLDNSILIVELRLPALEEIIAAEETQSGVGEGEITEGGYGAGRGCRLDIIQQIPHGVEVNRARYSPLNPNLIATRQGSDESAVLLFDRTRHPSKPSDNLVKADLTLVGHKSEGYGLCWNANKEGELITCGSDQMICLWNLSSGSRENRVIQPVQTFTGIHSGIIEDCEFHPTHSALFGSVADDQLIAIWDSRHHEKPVQKVEFAHMREINSISFNPHSEFLFATASSDRTVKLWDLRNLNAPIHTLVGHQDELFTVQWAPFSIDVLASSGSDKRIFVWDLSLIGSPQTDEDAKSGPSELLFVHGGHTDRISEFSWNPNADEEWTIASVADDNIIQCWRMAENIHSVESQDKQVKSNQTNKNTGNHNTGTTG